MTFLSPLSAALAGAIGASVLLLLYVLRLRRRVVRIPSTMLWPGVREDLEVNTPFRRLRVTPLLLLQMLAVLLLAAALGEPVIDAGPEPRGRTIVLVDRSASMSAPADPTVPDGPTRLAVALEAAAAEIDRRTAGRGGRDPGELMLIAFDARPTVVRGFERRPGPLLDALRTIGPSDGEADLEAAMQLASAFVVTGDEGGDDVPEVLLLTDGGTAPPRGRGPILLARAALDVRSPVAGAGAGGDGDAARAEAAAAIRNVGIVACTARRGDEEPEVARLFVRLANAGPEPVIVDVRIDRDDAAVTTERLTIPAAEPDGPMGEQTLAVDVRAPDPALLRVAVTRVLPGPGASDAASADQLAADDVAAVRLPPAASPRIAVVAPDARPFGALAALLEATGPTELRRLDEAGWRRLAEAGPADEVDLVVFDRARGPALPAVPSLWFGAWPPGVERVSDPRPDDAAAGDEGEGGADVAAGPEATVDAADAADAEGGSPPEAGEASEANEEDDDVAAASSPPPDEDRGRRILSWRRSHPVMRYVALDEVAFAGFDAFREPPRAEVLARDADGPVIMEVPAAGTRHVLVGFALDRTNWTADVGFAVFVQNAIAHLAATGRGQPGRSVQPGEPVTVRLRPDVEAGDPVRVEGPLTTTVEAGSSPDLLLPALPLVGTYAVDAAVPPDDVVAVNLASAVETDLRPRPVDSVRARETRSGVARAEAPRDLWPWFVAAAGVLAMVEWLLYARMVRG